jgi:hypothetical protein
MRKGRKAGSNRLNGPFPLALTSFGRQAVGIVGLLLHGDCPTFVSRNPFSSLNRFAKFCWSIDGLFLELLSNPSCVRVCLVYEEETRP